MHIPTFNTYEGIGQYWLIYDGITKYYAGDGSENPAGIAMAFAVDYETEWLGSDNFVVASIRPASKGPENNLYFAFNSIGDFEWQTERKGGARHDN